MKRSTGRGGLGNIADESKSPRIQPQDLQTPTLTNPVITTGRGGSGNFVKNTDPAETRARQDVEPVLPQSNHPTLLGRGGAGNVLSSDERNKAERAEAVAAGGGDGSISPIVEGSESERRKSPGGGGGDGNGLAAKGKEWLFGKKG